MGDWFKVLVGVENFIYKEGGIVKIVGLIYEKENITDLGNWCEGMGFRS